MCFESRRHGEQTIPTALSSSRQASHWLRARYPECIASDAASPTPRLAYPHPCGSADVRHKRRGERAVSPSRSSPFGSRAIRTLVRESPRALLSLHNAPEEKREDSRSFQFSRLDTGWSVYYFVVSSATRSRDT